MPLKFERFGIVEENGQSFAEFACRDDAAAEDFEETPETTEYADIRVKVTLNSGELVKSMKSSILRQIRAEIDRVLLAEESK